MGALSIVKRFFLNVENVIDAKGNARIEVTKGDCNSKAVRSHGECAMAVACKRQLHLDGVIISRSVAYLVKGKTARRFMLPPSVSREVVSFDRGAGFEPGTYELAKVSESTKLGARPERLKDDRNHANQNKVKRFSHYTTKARHVLGGLDPDKAA